MADRCMICHTDVRSQLQGNNGIHGSMLANFSPSDCKACHPEHGGSLTGGFDHNRFAFKLTGAHVNVPCQGCHANATTLQDLQNTPQDCYSCHSKQDPHNGTFGTNCGGCHNTSSWTGANFNHAIFPINHGTNQQASTCQTCHPNGFATYTCFGCHFHTPQNVVGQHEGQSAAALQDCSRCHAGGKVPD